MKRVRIDKSGISGQGVFALESIKKGEIIILMSGKRVRGKKIDELVKKKTIRFDDPFEIGEDRYIVLGPVPVSVNHSCDPNAGVQKVNTLFALRAIKMGEEVTYDYSTVVGRNAEGESDWFMRCKCGAKICRHKVGNWLTLPTKRFAYYKLEKALPDFILAQVKSATPYFVYLLECADGSIYTGITTDVVRRLAEHKKGIGSHYTRARGAVRLVHSEMHFSRSSALKREAAIKRLPKIKKVELTRRA